MISGIELGFFPASMKPVPMLRISRIMPVLCRIAPPELKYQVLLPPALKKSLLNVRVLNMSQIGVRKFSTRSVPSKSLVEDEADLSDWVSGLSSSSFKKTRVYSDSENEEESGNGERGGYRSRERDGKRQSEDRFDKGFERETKNNNFSNSRFRERGRGPRDSSNFRRESGGEKFGRISSKKDDKNDSFSKEKNDFNSSNWRRENGRTREKAPEVQNRRVGRAGDLLDGKSKRNASMFSRDRDFSESNRWRDNGSKRNDGLFSRDRDFSGSNRLRDNGSKRNDGLFSRDRDFSGSNRLRDNGSKRNDSLFSKDRDFSGSNRLRDNRSKRNDSLFSKDTNFNEKGGENRKDTWQGRNRGVDNDGRGMERERRGLGRVGMVLNEVDDEEDEEGGEQKNFLNFKKLIDSDEVDEDEDEDDEVEMGEQQDDEEENDALFAKGSNFLHMQQRSEGKSDSYLSESRFDQCSISPLSLKGIQDAGFERMTLVQEATLPVILKGKDVLAKAKTGTGKTVAFLLPAIELVLQSSSATRDQKRPPIFVLIICPTRELANQAATEANTLLKYHLSIGVQVVIGGTRLALEQKRMQANPCQILVATPGRLRDHIENTAGFATRLMGVKILVLDEADHLLDMGFRKEIEKIVAAVPKLRQTLLFSATIPQEVQQICHIALKRDHEFINTVQEGSEDTHSQVRQMHLVAPLDKHFSLLYTLLKDHIADDVNFKILVFCTTAMVTKLTAEVLGELNLNVREIHSRKPQSYRTRVSDEFRKSKGLILVTSDVSARGVDYPDVTLVIQIGVPSDREQYIHRLGRTGRKGKEGEGILLLAPWEEFFLSNLKDLPMSKAPEPMVDPDTLKKVERALAHVEMKSKESAYQAWLGYYNSNKNIGRDKYRLVELANEFSRSMGLDNPPAIPKLVLGKMGLKNIPGLRTK